MLLCTAISHGIFQYYLTVTFSTSIPQKMASGHFWQHFRQKCKSFSAAAKYS